MDVAEELHRGNRKAVKLWLVTVEPHYLWSTITVLAKLQDMELFRIANKRFLDSEVVDHWDHGLLRALEIELERLNSETCEPEIAYAILARMSMLGFRLGMTVPTPADTVTTYTKEMVTYTVVPKPLNVYDFSPWRLVAYLIRAMRKDTSNPWVAQIMHLLLTQMKKLPSWAEAWNRSIFHGYDTDWEELKRWFTRPTDKEGNGHTK